MIATSIMERHLLLLLALLFVCGAINAQVRFSAYANVYNKQNQKVGNQFISANISNGSGSMTLGERTMRVIITNSVRNDTYKMSAYSATLSSPDGKTVDVVITKYDKGGYTILVYFGDGELRYDVGPRSSTNNSYLSN